MSSSGTADADGLEQFGQGGALLIAQRRPVSQNLLDVLRSAFRFELATQLGYVSVGIPAFLNCDL
jgi:hypothetical protein